tara:strand:+ start:684 stop:1550 length:867 start_codon:yes stop_codon:yes gene_type:complete
MRELIDDITIILVLYQEREEIVTECLKNIKNFKIIIVDNDNNLVLKKNIVSNFNIYKYIINKKNIGFTKAANIAINLINTEYVLNLNADCLIKENDILKLLISHKKYNNCFIASPTLYDNNNKISYNAGAFSIKNLKKNILSFDGDVCVDWVLGSAVLFKKKDMQKLGMLDENYFLYFEDEDICIKARKNNMSVIQAKDSKAQHIMGKIKGRNMLKNIYLKNYNFTYDELYFYFKNYGQNEIYFSLKKKIVPYIFKMTINLILFKLSKSIYYFSRLKAFFDFSRNFKI